MTEVRLTFSRSPGDEWLGTGGPVRRACAALLLAMAVVAVGFAARSWQAAREDKRSALAGLERAVRTEALSPLAARTKPAGTAIASLSATTPQADLDVLVSRLNVPWPRLLNALERAALPSIHITSLESDAKARRFTIMSESQTVQPLLRFADRLGQAQEFERIALHQHEDRIDEAAAASVRLALSVTWGDRPASSGAAR